MMPFTRWTRVWIVAGLAEGVAFVSLDGHPDVQAVIYVMASLGAAVIVVPVMIALGRQSRVLTVPLAAGTVCYAVANTVWCFYPLLAARLLPDPSVVEGLFMVSYGLYGLVLWRWSAQLVTLDRHGGLDAIIIAAGLSPVLLAGLMLGDPHVGVDWATTTLFVYPIATLVVAALALRLFFVAGARTRLHVLAMAWIAFEFVGNVVYAFEGVRGTFRFGQPWQVCWILSSVALGALALRCGEGGMAEGRNVLRSPVTAFRLPTLGVMLFLPAVTLVYDQEKVSLDLYDLSSLGLVIVLVLVRLSGLMTNLGDQRDEHQVVVALSADLEHLAFRDSLTSLANRAALLRTADHALGQRRRSADRGTGMLLLDLDDFKIVNDTFGHDAGDQLLRVVADRLRATCRRGDTVARLGGDEFAILVDDTDAAQLAGLGHRVVTLLNEPYDRDGVAHRPRASAGLALATQGQDLTALLIQADTAMYAAKAAGGNTFCVFDALTCGEDPLVGHQGPKGSSDPPPHYGLV